ncbi:MAG: ribonuclease D [Halieaceae bacterium]|jgi:ribonuclease D
MNWTLVVSNEGLATALEALANAREIAVDTEFMRRSSYYPHVALLQLCGDEHAWLIDPLKVDALDGLRSLMVDPARQKILHSCSEDLEVFRHWLGVLPDPLVDTQRAAALLGMGFGMGYRTLIQELLGIELDKGETRSDWLRRPLTESQCSYAAQDVLHLLPAWRILRDRALDQARMPWLLEEGAEARHMLAEREQDIYRRVKSASRLPPRQLAVLEQLCNWREGRARDSDTPRGWVLDDKACIAISQAMPENMAALGALEAIPAGVLRKQGEKILTMVENCRGLDADSLPAALNGSLSPSQRTLLKQVRGTARGLAEPLGVAPEILASGSDLELLVREATGETIEVPRRWLGWRADAVIAPLRVAIGGVA